MRDIVDVLESVDNKRKTDLRKYVNKSLEKTEIREPITKDSYTKVSHLVRCCPREECICSMKSIQRNVKYDYRTKKMFEFGRLFERYWRDDVLGNLGIVIGRWKCINCHFVLDDVDGKTRYKKPIKCEKCGYQQFSYVEEEIRNDLYRIQGHTDGFISWGDKYHIIELKSVNSFKYQSVKSIPDMDHQLQIQMYMWLYGFKNGLIWYMDRDSTSDVCFPLELEMRYVTHVLEKSQQIRDFFVTGVLPPVICAKGSPRFEKCTVGNLCMS